MKKVLLSALAICVLSSCSTQEEVAKESKNFASIVPLASIWNFISQDSSFESIIKPGISPHSFDLKTKDALDISKSNLILITETSIDEQIHSINEEKNLDISSWIDKLAWWHHHDEHEHEDENHEDEHHDEDWHNEEEHNDIFDPHFWLGIQNSKKIAENIEVFLSKQNPEKESEYKENLAKFNSEVDYLLSDFKTKSKWKEPDKFIILHNAYAYLFKDLGIHEDDFEVIEDIPTIEANTVKMKELVDKIQSENIKFIFKEPQISSSTLDYLQEKYNMEVLVLDPIGQSESKDWYIDNLTSNLNNLKKLYE